jgi:NAD(P)-dependent dehydrogenase (short-subunit alcohol dehydrogenase family)
VEGLRPALEQRRGAVVLISSNSAQIMEYSEAYIQALLSGDREEAVSLVQAVDGQTAYGGGKQALARWMRRENGAYAGVGVRMNAVAPGYTETNMTAAGKASAEYGDAMRAFVASIPLGRPGMPEDQANAVAFLLSEQASFISGSVLFVDGGHDAMFRPDSF